MVNFTQSSDESFYQVNVILPKDFKINLQNFILIAYSSQNIPCGVAKYENLGTKMGYQIAVQGRDANSSGTETYPYFIAENLLSNLPQNILNELKPRFSLMNERTKRTFKLLGDIPNFKTYSLLEVDLNINKINGGF